MNTPVPNVGPELKSVSPSQLNTFRLCPRAHWLQKRCGLKTPEGPSLLVGTGYHSAKETYFEKGQMYDPDAFSSSYFPSKPELREMLKTALESGRQLLKDEDAPKFKPGLMVEVPRSYHTGLKIAGVALRQRSDLLDPTDASLLRSYDHKTSGRVFSDYSKSGEELAYDPQGVLYAWEAMEKFKPDAVVFSHLTVGTKTVEYSITSTDPLTKEHIDTQVGVLGETVAKMKEHFAISNFHETRPGPGAPSASFGSPCRAFGGCAFVDLCGVVLPEKKSTNSTPQPQESVVSSTTTKPLSFKERLAQAKLAQGINPPDAASPSPVVPYVPPAASATPPTTNPAAIIKQLQDLLGQLAAALGAP